ncbi:unnamed protein product [Linum trigynum]|uniref:Ty3 transposon capsid-like protein domain-containing protein n=1 Tax=Linum trigynum TaxID=586398 RepID=A0AAV2DS10_9ROSI
MEELSRQNKTILAHLTAFCHRSEAAEQRRTRVDVHLQRVPPVRQIAEPEFASGIPLFYGNNSREWVRKCARVFAKYGIPEEHRVMMAASYFDHRPAIWFEGLKSCRKELVWGEFAISLCSRFSDWESGGIVGEFKRLRQRGSLIEYHENFEDLKSHMLRYNPALTEEFFISSFISGLQEELRPIVKMLQPQTLAQAYHQAQFEMCLRSLDGDVSTALILVLEENAENAILVVATGSSSTFSGKIICAGAVKHINTNLMAATANGNDFEENGSEHNELLDLSEEGLCLAESLSNEADVDEDEDRQGKYSESDKEAKPFSLPSVMGVERNISIHPVSAQERNTANGDLVVDTRIITTSSEGTLLQVKAGLGESSCIPSTVSLPTAGQPEHHCDLENGLELDTKEGTIVTEFAGLDKIVIDDAEYNKRKMVKIIVNHELQLQLDFPVHVDLNTDSVQPSLKQCKLRELVYEQSVKPTQYVRTSFPTPAMVISSEMIGIIEPQAVDVVEDSALSGVPPRVVKSRLCFQQHQLVHGIIMGFWLLVKEIVFYQKFNGIGGLE